MQDVAIQLDHRRGALARMGQVLGDAGVSVEGGGVFVTGGHGVAHFPFHDGTAAATALTQAGITVHAVRDVLLQRLRQDEPGQLGAICARMAEAGVNIEVMYSDHDHQLVLVVDDHETGRAVSTTWNDQRT